MRITAPSLKFLALVCFFIFPLYLFSQESTIDLRHKEAWKGEFFLGHRLSQQRDFSLAIESFKRAQALCPSETLEPRRLIDHQLIEVYFALADYRKVIETFVQSPLALLSETKDQDPSFWFKIYKSYEKLGEHSRADELFKQLANNPNFAIEPLLLSQAFSRHEWSSLDQWMQNNPKFSFLKEGIEQYKSALKSKRLAKWLSICIPGAGYYYAGRHKSGITSFLINGLLIAASMQCFTARLYTLGILTSTFEMGWYFGGIFGAVKAAGQHNDQLFDQLEAKLQEIDFSNHKPLLLNETLD